MQNGEFWNIPRDKLLRDHQTTIREIRQSFSRESFYE